MITESTARVMRCRERATEEGRCNDCASRPAADGCLKCEVCLEAGRRRRAELRAQGLCTACQEPSPDKAWCDDCSAKYRPQRLSYDYNDLRKRVTELTRLHGEPWDTLCGDVAAIRIRKALRGQFPEADIDKALLDRLNYLMSRARMKR